MQKSLIKSQKVIECEATPIEKRSSGEKKPSRTAYLIAAGVALIAIFKIVGMVFVGLFLLRRFPRLILGSLLTSTGFAFWRKNKSKLSQDRTAAD